MKKIPLGNNRGFVLVDDFDFEELSKHKWRLAQQKHTSYARADIKRDGKWVTISMHRLIMGEPKGLQVDHRDSNGLNNQRFNLRKCTNSQNCMNQRKTRGISQYKGVSWYKKARKWRAYIQKDGKNIHLGCRDTEIECAMLYDVAAKENYGEFARTNF